MLLGTSFFRQLAPDIKYKLQKQVMGPQTLIDQLLNLAFGIFNNQDMIEGQQKVKRKQLTGKSGPN
jgi:hypothetical protein